MVVSRWEIQQHVVENVHRFAVLGGNPSLLYPTTKGAIIQMTRAMAAHHGKEGIRVNCVAPGMVFTPMVRSRGVDDQMRKARVGQNLMGKEGTGWDVGYGELFCLLDFRKADLLLQQYYFCAAKRLVG